MDRRAIILQCLHENWPAEASMIGDHLMTRIADDALQQRRTVIQPAQGGYNFDLAPYINTIIDATDLLVNLAGVYLAYRTIPGRRPLDTMIDTTSDTGQDLVTDDDLVEVLTQYLVTTKGMERKKANKLARTYVNFNSR